MPPLRIRLGGNQLKTRRRIAPGIIRLPGAFNTARSALKHAREDDRFCFVSFLLLIFFLSRFPFLVPTTGERSPGPAYRRASSVRTQIIKSTFRQQRFNMSSKLSIVVLLAVIVCSCHGISGRRSVRSAALESSVKTNPTTGNVVSTQDSAVTQSSDVFSGRGKKGGGGGGHKNKMEMMHMGLSYVKMVISTVMAFIGHVFAFKSVGLALISVLIQIAQFVMTLKKSKDGAPPAYKVVETPWHTTPADSYGNGGGGGAYGIYGGGHSKSGYAGAPVPSAYGNAQPVGLNRRRRR